MSKKVLLSLFLSPLSPVLFLIIFFISGCSLGEKVTETNGELSYAIEKVEEAFERIYTVPLLKDYPVVYVELREPFEIPGLEHFEGYYTVLIGYGMEKGDIAAFYKDEGLVERFEKDRGVLVLYGAYDGTRIADLEYSPLNKNMSFLDEDGKGNWIIKNEEIEYIYLSKTQDRAREYIMANLPLAEGGIFATYYLSDDFTEKDAKSFTEYLVDMFY
jgi:hypothetical protein